MQGEYDVSNATSLLLVPFSRQNKYSYARALYLSPTYAQKYTTDDHDHGDRSGIAICGHRQRLIIVLFLHPSPCYFIEIISNYSRRSLPFLPLIVDRINRNNQQPQIPLDQRQCC